MPYVKRNDRSSLTKPALLPLPFQLKSPLVKRIMGADGVPSGVGVTMRFPELRKRLP